MKTMVYNTAGIVKHEINRMLGLLVVMHQVEQQMYGCQIHLFVAHVFGT